MSFLWGARVSEPSSFLQDGVAQFGGNRFTKPSKNVKTGDKGEAELDKAMILWELRGGDVDALAEAKWD